MQNDFGWHLPHASRTAGEIRVAASPPHFAAMTDPPIEPEDWDTIVVGSGLAQCLAARCAQMQHANTPVALAS